MTYTVPYAFVPGTKAKAEEVNANFNDVIEKLSTINSRIDTTNTTLTDNTTSLQNSITSLNTNKANKTEIDGNWVLLYYTVCTDVALYNANSTPADYSIATIIPQDGNLYELAIRARTVTGTTSGNFAPAYVGTDWTGDVTFPVCGLRTRVNGAMDSVGSTIIQGKNKIRLLRSPYYAGTAELVIVGYRKVR